MNIHQNSFKYTKEFDLQIICARQEKTLSSLTCYQRFLNSWQGNLYTLIESLKIPQTELEGAYSIDLQLALSSFAQAKSLCMTCSNCTAYFRPTVASFKQGPFSTVHFVYLLHGDFLHRLRYHHFVKKKCNWQFYISLVLTLF